MYKILDLKRVFSTFQETVWSLLKSNASDDDKCIRATADINLTCGQEYYIVF